MALAIGAKVTGKVTGIKDFGAFVDLGDGQSGLVHISEISAGYVKDIHDVLKVGDTVTVKILTIKDGKVGLSIKQANPETAAASQSHHAPSHRGAPTNHQHQARPSRGALPRHNGGHGDFDDLMSGFLKESEDRLSSLRKNTEGKRGGRGGRRN